VGSLLKVSEAATIGLHAACLLSKKLDEVLTASEIAGTLDVSETHLSKVMNRLQKGGLIKSVIGPGGGFCLAQKPTEITLFDVLECIDGPAGDATCLFSPPRCEGGGCVIGDISAEVNELVRRRMGSLSLADVASDSSQMRMLAIQLLNGGKKSPAQHKSRKTRSRK